MFTDQIVPTNSNTITTSNKTSFHLHNEVQDVMGQLCILSTKVSLKSYLEPDFSFFSQTQESTVSQCLSGLLVLLLLLVLLPVIGSAHILGAPSLYFSMHLCCSLSRLLALQSLRRLIDVLVGPVGLLSSMSPDLNKFQILLAGISFAKAINK